VLANHYLRKPETEGIKNMENNPLDSIRVEKPTMPKRIEDCPAVDVCKRLGNRRKSCLAGSPAIEGPPPSVCMASLILLGDQIVQGLAERD